MGGNFQMADAEQMEQIEFFPITPGVVRRIQALYALCVLKQG